MWNKKRNPSRSRFSTLINLLVLVALFTAVFALQRLGKDNDEESKSNPESPPVEIATKPTKIETDQKPAPQIVVLPTSIKEPSAYAPTDSCACDTEERTVVRKKKPFRSARRGIGWEDRLRSAQLVDMLDGGKQPSSRDYPQSYPTRTAYSSYGSDLDGDAARQQYLNENQGYQPPQAQYPEQPRQRQATYASSESSYSGKPSWDVNVGNR